MTHLHLIWCPRPVTGSSSLPTANVHGRFSRLFSATGRTVWAWRWAAWRVCCGPKRPRASASPGLSLPRRLRFGRPSARAPQTDCQKDRRRSIRRPDGVAAMGNGTGLPVPLLHPARPLAIVDCGLRGRRRLPCRVRVWAKASAVNCAGSNGPLLKRISAPPRPCLEPWRDSARQRNLGGRAMSAGTAGLFRFPSPDKNRPKRICSIDPYQRRGPALVLILHSYPQTGFSLGQPRVVFWDDRFRLTW